MDLKVESKPDEPTPARPQPSPINFYARTLASEMRRFRNNVTRENIVGFLKNMAWTIPLTVLIWVYAESEQVVLDTDRSIAIEVKSRDPAKVVWLGSGEKAIMCDIRGPRSNVERFTASLSPSAPITIDLDTHRLPNQEEPILTLENLKENPRFKDAGVTIEKCTPPTLTVFVDTLETRQLPVQAPPNIPGLNATFNPPTVSVTGPSRVLEQMAHVTADIGSLPSLNQAGPHPTQKVSLVGDSASSVTYSPSQVDATLSVQEKDVVYTCKNVPVWFDIQPTTADQFAISVASNSGFVPKVEVIGPPEQIARMRQGDVPAPRAVLEIGPDNVRNTNPVQLKIEDLPEGVRVNGPNPEISFTATPRS